MPNGLFYRNALGRSIPNIWTVWLVLVLLPRFIETAVFHTNSVDPDQTPQNAASGQGLNGLPISLDINGLRL